MTPPPAWGSALERPLAQLGPEGMRRPVGQPGLAAKKAGDLLGLVLLVCLVCNILLTVWIFTDIRKRGEGSGIFIAMALVAGIPAAIIYSLARIGDKVAAAEKPKA